MSVYKKLKQINPEIGSKMIGAADLTLYPKIAGWLLGCTYARTYVSIPKAII
jgi:hypothetical protein